MRRAAPWMMAGAALDRAGPTTLIDQIAHHVEAAIIEGALPPAARLPSWRDLAAQLGVARGTVKAAYEKLVDRQLLVTAGSAGTRVADPLPAAIIPTPPTEDGSLLPPDAAFRSDEPLAFEMGVPAHDSFPATLWARLHRHAVQATALRTGHADPRGAAELRAALASHVAIARGIECSPDQILVTGGFRVGLSIALQAVGATGKQAWVEDPGYPATRIALELAGARPVAIPVDPRACTPASVRPATVSSGWSSRRMRRSAAWSSPCTVRRPGCTAHPENPVPSYAMPSRTLMSSATPTPSHGTGEPATGTVTGSHAMPTFVRRPRPSSAPRPRPPARRRCPPPRSPRPRPPRPWCPRPPPPRPPRPARPPGPRRSGWSR